MFRSIHSSLRCLTNPISYIYCRRSLYSNIKDMIDVEADSRKTAGNYSYCRHSKFNCFFMDDSEYGGFFSLWAHGICAYKYKHLHLRIPYSKVGTYYINLSTPVLISMEYFTIKDKFISYTSNRGSNLKMFRDSLEGKLQTPQFTAHNKLFFDNICFPICYNVHARHQFWVASPRITRAQSPCALQQSKMVSRLVLCGRRRVHLVQYN